MASTPSAPPSPPQGTFPGPGFWALTASSTLPKALPSSSLLHATTDHVLALLEERYLRQGSVLGLYCIQEFPQQWA